MAAADGQTEATLAKRSHRERSTSSAVNAKGSSMGDRIRRARGEGWRRRVDRLNLCSQSLLLDVTDAPRRMPPHLLCLDQVCCVFNMLQAIVRSPTLQIVGFPDG